MGAYYAVLLEDAEIEHIHVHHGYFGSWVAMIAARLLGVGFSMTLHGSDLLLHRAYLDTTLKSCAFCVTISEYNRRYILQRYPGVAASKVVVARLGVDVPELADERPPSGAERALRFSLLSVGRLEAVKDHAFLVRACAQLQVRDLDFECVIAGEGPERPRLESLIQKHGLEQRVTLVGHVARDQMASLYARADAVVLTSRSEGIPLMLMEAMALGKIVLAPAITGIPELVASGKTGYLYEPGSCGDFVARLLLIYSLGQADLHACPQSSFPSARRPLDWVAHGAKAIVRHNFNRTRNLEVFANILVQRTAERIRSLPHEDSLLQQVQLSI
jgi:glycosyltransferase involved in cell wall biosynthesis